MRCDALLRAPHYSLAATPRPRHFCTTIATTRSGTACCTLGPARFLATRRDELASPPSSGILAHIARRAKCTNSAVLPQFFVTAPRKWNFLAAITTAGSRTTQGALWPAGLLAARRKELASPPRGWIFAIVACRAHSANGAVDPGFFTVFIKGVANGNINANSKEEKVEADVYLSSHLASLEDAVDGLGIAAGRIDIVA